MALKMLTFSVHWRSNELPSAHYQAIDSGAGHLWEALPPAPILPNSVLAGAMPGASRSLHRVRKYDSDNLVLAYPIVTVGLAGSDAWPTAQPLPQAAS
jgi:hypothetical protein